MKTKGTVLKSVSRAIKILKYLADSKKASLGEIPNGTNMIHSTAHHVLNTLKIHEIIDQDADCREYSLARKAYQIGAAAKGNYNNQTIIIPYMKELLYKFKETVSLGVLNGVEVIYI